MGGSAGLAMKPDNLSAAESRAASLDGTRRSARNRNGLEPSGVLGGADDRRWGECADDGGCCLRASECFDTDTFVPLSKFYSENPQNAYLGILQTKTDLGPFQRAKTKQNGLFSDL